MQQALNRLRVNADTCRNLAFDAITPAARDVLSDLAAQYEQKVVALEIDAQTHPHRRPAFKWPLT